MMAVLTLFAIIGTAKVEAYTATSLDEGIAASTHLTSSLRMATLAIETCTSQIGVGDYRNVDTCISLMKTFDKYVSIAMTESSTDIQKITGYGVIN